MSSGVSDRANERAQRVVRSKRMSDIISFQTTVHGSLCTAFIPACHILFPLIYTSFSLIFIFSGGFWPGDMKMTVRIPRHLNRKILRTNDNRQWTILYRKIIDNQAKKIWSHFWNFLQISCSERSLMVAWFDLVKWTYLSDDFGHSGSRSRRSPYKSLFVRYRVPFFVESNPSHLNRVVVVARVDVGSELHVFCSFNDARICSSPCKFSLSRSIVAKWELCGFLKFDFTTDIKCVLTALSADTICMYHDSLFLSL